MFNRRLIGKLKGIGIMLGALLACIVPFIHVMLPKVPHLVSEIQKEIAVSETPNPELEKQLAIAKEKVKVRGFNTARSFWYAIGQPITMFYFSFVIMLSLRSIGDKYMRQALQVSSIILMTIAVYFITWALWAAGDFPKTYYYIIIGVISILSTWMSFSLIQHFSRVQLMVKRL